MLLFTDLGDVKHVNGTIENIFIKKLYEKDKTTYHHCLRVKNLSLILGKTVRLADKEICILAKSALLHDIGKIAIEDEVLNKPGALSKEQWSVMKEHPIYGELMFLNYTKEKDDKVVGEVIRHHHEHFNGKGYPYGLRGENIPFLSRLISVVDVFEALTSKRPYREPCSIKESVMIMSDLSGNQLDPWLTDIFIHKVLKY